MWYVKKKTSQHIRFLTIVTNTLKAFRKPFVARSEQEYGIGKMYDRRLDNIS